MLPKCKDPHCLHWQKEARQCTRCDNPVNVVIMWHMHQPEYQDLLDHSFFLPWTYLHAIKDYWDIARILEESPGAKTVVNFSAALLEQLDEYGRQLDNWFASRQHFGDELLNSLAQPLLSPDLRLRKRLLQQCVRANEKHLIHRYPDFTLLAEVAREALQQESRIAYLNDQCFFDLLVWYHLAWMGETVKRQHADCQYLLNKGRLYSEADRQLLVQLIREVVHGVIPAYRRLLESGQVELTVTPENHPIIPLLLDFHSARESLPDSPIPAGSYPGGKARATAQIRRGLEIFEAHFGQRPVGCWPGEGALSDDTLALLAEQGITWTASGAGVLYNSLAKTETDAHCIHHAYQFGNHPITCFFRDDNLSDLIGFTFHDWDANDAVNHLIHHIDNIQGACNSDPGALVPIILDGENCWEYYPFNGYYFLRALYDKLSNHPRIRLTTFADYLQQQHTPLQVPHLTAGSWVNGNLATWMGDADKNRGWELLVQAKKAYDRTIESLSPKQQQLAEQQLSVCEASDWFWWFGDYNAAESVSDFDRLYRRHLRNLYHTLGLDVPPALAEVISIGSGTPENDGTMRRGNG